MIFSRYRDLYSYAHGQTERRSGSLRFTQRITVICVGLALLAGCASDAIELAPPSADQPWQDPQVQQDLTKPMSDFSVAPVPDVTEPVSSSTIKHDHSYTLLDLIDLAQQNNNQTKTAWNHARQAALAVGMAEATFLPIISATAIGGRQRTNVDSPLLIGPRQFETTVSGFVPALTLGWLIFDFGQRASLLEAAQQLSRAANILFNAAHQQVIWQVTTRFYEYNLTREQVLLAKDALKQRQTIARATRARREAGLATVVETALSDQMVAQAQLHLVNMQGFERNAYLNLIAAAGISPMTEVKIASEATRNTSRHRQTHTQLSQDAIRQAISSRPDIAAGYAAMQAAQANIKAVEADFMPKVFLAGMVASSHSNFRLQAFPSIQQNAQATGVLLGISMPIYEGGVRSARLVGAQIRSEQASENFGQLQRDAVREIILAQTVLDSAYQSEATASHLVKTARTAYNAALDSYREGMATITMVTEGANALLHAQQALLEAKIGVKVSSANLAFALGQMTSANAALSSSEGTLKGSLSVPQSSSGQEPSVRSAL